jgi:hypothetical protein
MFVRIVFMITEDLIRFIYNYNSEIIGFDSPLIPEGSKVLDVACGHRPFSGNYETVGMDIERIEIKHSIENHEGDYVLGILGNTHLPFKDNSFDAVVCHFISELGLKELLKNGKDNFERLQKNKWQGYLKELLRVSKKFSLIASYGENIGYLEVYCNENNYDFNRLDDCIIQVMK